MKTKLATMISLCLSCGIVPSVYASQATEQISEQTMQLSFEKNMMVASKFSTLEQAVSSFYTTYLRWPTSLSEITTGGTEVFYTGDFKTPYGTITGSSSGLNTFSLILSVDATPTDLQLSQFENVAGQIGGDYIANTVRLSVPIPYTASVVKNMLQRTEDLTGNGLNEMETNLSLGSHDITNIEALFGTNATFTDLNGGTGLLEATNSSFDTVTTVDYRVTTRSEIEDGDADSATFDSLTVNNQLNAGSLSFTTLTADDLAVTNQLTTNDVSVTDLATITLLKAKNVEFEYGNFAASLSAINANSDKFFTDDLLVDQFVSPVNFNTHTTINDVATLMSSLRVNGSLVQNSGIATLGHTTVSANLLTNDATFNDQMTVNQSALTKNVNFHKDVSVTGRTDLEALFGVSANISSTLDVDGSMTVANSLSLNGDLYAGSQKIADDGYWYENGVRIQDKYYGINEKVDDAGSLGGKDSSLLAVKARSNVFQNAATFSKNIYINGQMTAGSGILFDSSGNLYDQGQRVSSKYATKSELSSADSEIQSYISQVTSAVDSAINTKRSEIQGFEGRIAAVASAQLAIDSKHTQITTNLQTASSNLQSADNYLGLGSSSMNGAVSTINSVEGLASSISSYEGIQYNITNHTHVVNKEYN